MLKFFGSRSSSFWFIAAAVYLLICYLPDFTAVFGMHNDLSLIFKSPPWKHFIETDHMLVVGRPVCAFLTNIPYHTIHRLEDLGLWRFVSFLTMLVFLRVLWFYLEKRWGLSRIQAFAVIVSVGFLPVWLLAVTWVCQWPGGALTVLLAALTYLVWDRIRSRWGWNAASVAQTVLIVVLFQMLMFSYPVGAMAVFIFTFGYVLWGRGGLAQARAVVWTDMIFFGSGIIFYRLTERLWVTPWFFSRTHYIVQQPEYAMGMTWNVWGKLPLIRELVTSSLGGTWHLFMGAWGAGLWLAGLGGGLWLARKLFIRERAREYAERIFYLVALFILVNLPMLLAAGVTSVLGYRVLVAGSMMAGLALWKVWFGAEQAASLLGKKIITAAAAVFIGVWGAMACTHLMDVSENYRREEVFVAAAVRSWNPAKVKNGVFVKLPPGQTFLKRHLPYEFGFMITDPQHLIPLILRAQKDLPATPHRVIYYVMTPAEAARLAVRDDIAVMDEGRAATNGH